MPLQDLLMGNLRLVLFGGKGGVGKTTCAAATGLYAARLGKKALTYSTDPAHSLSDVFGQKIGEKATQIEGVEGLFAMEVSAEKALKELRGLYREEIEEALSQILVGFDMPFDREIARDLMDLSPPGMDELMALKRLNELVREHDYDLIIVDTAAGEHTIRLLELPQLAEGLLGWALHVQDELRYVMPLERTRLLLESMKEEAAGLRALLKDPGQTAFILVTIPETMGVCVAEDMTKGLRACKVPFKNIIVNFAIPSRVNCSYCLLRRKGQAKCISEIREKFPECETFEALIFPYEIKGLGALEGFAKALFEEKYEPKFHSVLRATTMTLSERPRLEVKEKGHQLVIFGGKGGCGKTTSSAATGVYMARRGKKSLVVSADPQRSLSDSFDQSLGGEIAPIEGVPSLYGLEIDSERLLKEFKERHREDIVEIVASATYLRREDVAQLLDFSLPGMDEFMALVELIRIVRREEFDLIVLDTAPTGHALRFLELPSLISAWARVMVKMRSKTKYIAQRLLGRPLRERADIFLEGLMNNVKMVRAVLTDPFRTEFIAVTTLEEMAISETERLLSNLALHRIPVKQMVVNGLVPESKGCDYCSSKSEEQLRALEGVGRRFPGLKIAAVPLFPHEIRGTRDLEEFASCLLKGLG